MDQALKFRHFIPSSSDQQLCNSHLTMIQDLAPADSYVDVIVDKLADGTFRTVISIKAICGKFIARNPATISIYAEPYQPIPASSNFRRGATARLEQDQRRSHDSLPGPDPHRQHRPAWK